MRRLIARMPASTRAIGRAPSEAAARRLASRQLFDGYLPHEVAASLALYLHVNGKDI